MRRLYFIQYFINDLLLENKIRSLGRFYQVSNGWVVESNRDARAIHEFLTSHNPAIDIIVLGLDKSNYWGRYATDFWEMFKQNPV